MSDAEPEPLDPTIAAAIEAWMARYIHESHGPGQRLNGQGEEIYTFQDFLVVIARHAPDAIARILQAGAAEFIRADSPSVTGSDAPSG